MKKIFKKVETLGFNSSRLMANVFTLGMNDFEKRKESDYIGRTVLTILGWIPILMILSVILVIAVSFFK